MCKEVCTCDRGFIGNRVKNLENGRQVLDWKNSSVFILYTANDMIVLSKQKRAGDLDKGETLGSFGGYLEEGESYMDALYREMYEETSLTKEDVAGVILVFDDRAVSEGYTTERSSGYIVCLKHTLSELMPKLKCLDEDEDIKFHVVNTRDNINFSSEEMPGLKPAIMYSRAMLLSKVADPIREAMYEE